MAAELEARNFRACRILRLMLGRLQYSYAAGDNAACNARANLANAVAGDELQITFISVLLPSLFDRKEISPVASFGASALLFSPAPLFNSGTEQKERVAKVKDELPGGRLGESGKGERR